MLNNKGRTYDTCKIIAPFSPIHISLSLSFSLEHTLAFYLLSLINTQTYYLYILFFSYNRVLYLNTYKNSFLIDIKYISLLFTRQSLSRRPILKFTRIFFEISKTPTFFFVLSKMNTAVYSDLEIIPFVCLLIRSCS